MSSGSDRGGCPAGYGAASSKVDSPSFPQAPTEQSSQQSQPQQRQKSVPSGCPAGYGGEGGGETVQTWPPTPELQGPFLTDVPSTDGLSNISVASNIPKAGAPEGTTWVFPSPQRFYNAARNKGWDASPDDMAVIVSIHNTVNERCWRKIMEYEAFHVSECPNPKLAGFTRIYGRDEDLSKKAVLMSYVGYKLPFDRHDWTVDRCGQRVRYIIDFYSGATASGDGRPATFLDVRPAPDSVGAIIDRLRMTVNEAVGRNTV